MYGFWELLVRPALEAADAREVVEVGSEGGRHTLRLLEWCAARGARLHVIEPEPGYDPDELAAAHRDCLVFHRATSLEALAGIARVDAVLLDGDHNWYTVFHELKSIATSHGRDFPLVLLHDVAWPFARRDMYYAPARIPGEARQAYMQGGLRRGEPKVLPYDGLSPELFKAIEEGGPRNGVRTAIEDFIRESPLPLRFEIVPVDFGLGFLATETLLSKRPALRALLDGLGDPVFREKLLLHLEERRIDDLVPLHSDNAKLRNSLEWTVADLGRHQAELARHEVEVKRLREMLARAIGDAQGSAARAAELDARVAALLSSRSWRVTEPLRRVGALLRGRRTGAP